MKEILDKKDVLDKLKALLSYAIIVDTSIPINENEGIGMGDIVQEIDDMDSLDPAVDLKEPFAEAQDKPDYEAMIEDLEIDFDGVYAFQLAARSARLKDILKKVRAEYTPKSEKPEGKDDSNK